VNQTLGTHASTNALNFVAPITDAGLLATLENGLPGKAKNIEAQVRLRATQPPYLYMHPDPPPFGGDPRPPEGEWPVTYNLGQWEMAVEVRKGNSRWRRAALAALDFYDDDFTFRLDESTDAKTLVPRLGSNPEVNLYLMDSALPGCPLIAIGRPTLGRCAETLRSQLESESTQTVIDLMESLLTEIPAPQDWDADDDATDGRRIQQTGDYIANQFLIYFGTLAP